MKATVKNSYQSAKPRFNSLTHEVEIENDSDVVTIERTSVHVPQDTVSVLLIDHETGEFVVVKEWRAGCKDFMVGAVSGYVEDGETPTEAARRECREETGYNPKTLVMVGPFYKSPGWNDERVWLFVGTHLEVSTAPGDFDELCEVVRVRDLVGMGKDDTPTDVILVTLTLLATNLGWSRTDRMVLGDS